MTARVKIVLAAVLLLFVTVGAHSETKAPEIKVWKISGTVYKINVEKFVNIVASVGPDGVLMVDTGFNKTSAAIKAKLKQLGSDDVKIIVNTHSDGDHWFGNTGLGPGAVIISHKKCRQRVREAMDKEKAAEDKEFIRKSMASVTFDKKLTIHFNGDEIRLIHLPGCHTDEDVMVYFKKANVLYMGDMYFSGSFPDVKFQKGGSIRRLIDNMAKIPGMFPEDVKIIVGHGRDCTTAELKKYHGMLVETVKLVKNAAKNGKTPEQMKKENLLKDWKSWNSKDFPDDLNTGTWIDTVYKNLH